MTAEPPTSASVLPLQPCAERCISGAHAEAQSEGLWRKYMLCIRTFVLGAYLEWFAATPPQKSDPHTRACLDRRTILATLLQNAIHTSMLTTTSQSIMTVLKMRSHWSSLNWASNLRCPKRSRRLRQSDALTTTPSALAARNSSIETLVAIAFSRYTCRKFCRVQPPPSSKLMTFSSSVSISASSIEVFDATSTFSGILSSGTEPAPAVSICAKASP
mmetsp:Transcript_640/g.1581  ORF Transcript_640/g.1581 Transcript_640/m.1581 type:complete len:217 (+) Transcript_640:75-725(+)